MSNDHPRRRLADLEIIYQVRSCPECGDAARVRICCTDGCTTPEYCPRCGQAVVQTIVMDGFALADLESGVVADARPMQCHHE